MTLGTPPRDDASGGDLEAAEALPDSTDELGTGGPWPEAARGWLSVRADDVRRLLDRHGELAAQAARRAHVVTHGEPHPGNVLVSEGGCLLID